MIFQTTSLPGVYAILPQRHADSRGFFARTWCQREFEEHGLDSRLVQCSVSFNAVRGTLRGMHFQAEPHPESKLVRCTRGAIFDIVIDIRPSSAAFRRWIGFELSAENRSALFIPPGCAHGFLTLEDSTEVFYQMSEFYHPDLARGVRWNDPSFGIELPFEPMVIADRDRSYPDFTPLPER